MRLLATGTYASDHPLQIMRAPGVTLAQSPSARLGRLRSVG